jgi:Fe-S oxidoreductase
MIAEPHSFSITEMAVLIALACASAAWFFVRLAPIVGNIRAARSEPGAKLRPSARGVREFLWEVLCQAKVIRERPLPGLAHAFVFWGFLVFALVSLNHLAVAMGLGFLSPETALGRFYFEFAGLWAVLVAISIAGLFVRRFLVRPRWLGEKLSIESGVIAGLIFLLMATYLAAFFVPGTSPASKALWWAHTLTLLAFLPVIPHTKHLHLLLSPITILFKRPRFAQIPPLAGDEDFGLAAGKDLTGMIALQAYSCVECGRCTEHCPAANTGKVLNPKELVLGARSYLNTFGAKSETPLLNEMREQPANASPDNPSANYFSMEAAFECTTCGACEYQCPVGIQHLPLIVGLRRGATNTGAWEDSYGTKLFLALERSGNALGLPASDRETFIGKAELPIFDGSQEYCLWLGCMGGYDPRGREIIRDFARVMQYLGTSFGVLEKEKCNGDPARRLGNDLVFQTLAEAGLSGLAAAGVKKIVTICPHCVRTIAEDWREFGVAPEIEHHSEFMARHNDKLPAKAGNNGEEAITFHDPCYLGRYRDVYEEPREIVRRSGHLIEPERNHQRSFCCGAGGGLAFLGEEAGERVSHTRARELAATGAQTVATACPFCNTMFRDALPAVSSEPPALLDIAQIAARNLPDSDGKFSRAVQD